MSLMPDYNSHVCGTWKIVTGWTLWHTTYTVKIFLFFSIIIGRNFKTTGSTDLHNSDYSEVSINSLTCFFLNPTCHCVQGGKLSSAFLNSWDKWYCSEQNYVVLMNMKCSDTKGAEKVGLKKTAYKFRATFTV